MFGNGVADIVASDGVERCRNGDHGADFGSGNNFQARTEVAREIRGRRGVQSGISEMEAAPVRQSFAAEKRGGVAGQNAADDSILGVAENSWDAFIEDKFFAAGEGGFDAGLARAPIQPDEQNGSFSIR